MQRDLGALSAWLAWHGVIAPLCWLCSWPARFDRACGEAMLAEVFSDEPATAEPWTSRWLRAVFRRAQQASGSTRL